MNSASYIRSKKGGRKPAGRKMIGKYLPLPKHGLGEDRISGKAGRNRDEDVMGTSGAEENMRDRNAMGMKELNSSNNKAHPLGGKALRLALDLDNVKVRKDELEEGRKDKKYRKKFLRGNK